MKKTPRFIVALLLLAVYASSCNNNAPTLTKYIPKDAAMVVGVNARNIAEKLAKANMDIDTLAALLTKNNADSTTDERMEWSELKSSGIDLGGEMYAFGKQANSIMEGKSTTLGVIASLKDAAAFQQYLKKKRPGGEIKTSGDYSYLALGDDYVVGWKNDVAILANVHGGKTAPGTYSTGEGTLSQQLLTTLFGQSASESVASVDAFKNVEKENGDMLFYSNVSAVEGNLPALSLTKVGDLLEGSYTTGTISFEDGEVVASFTGYTGKALGDILEKYPGHSIDEDAVDKFPLPVNGFVSLAFNPMIIGELVKFAGVEDIAKQVLAQYDLTINDVEKAFKGDITAAVAINGNIPPQSAEKTLANSPFKFVFNAAIGDKAAYDKVVTALKAKNIALPQNGTVGIPFMGGSGVAISVTDKNILVASDATTLQQYMAGGGTKNNLPGDIKDKIKGKSFAFYADISDLEKMHADRDADTSGKTATKNTSAPVLKDLIATADKVEGRVSKGKAELRLLDEKQNSLVAIVKNAFAKQKEGKHFMLGGMWRRYFSSGDSTAATLY